MPRPAWTLAPAFLPWEGFEGGSLLAVLFADVSVRSLSAPRGSGLSDGELYGTTLRVPADIMAQTRAGQLGACFGFHG